MPLYISEIGIRMAVRDPGDPADDSDGGDGSNGWGGGAPQRLDREEFDAIVEECVRTVLRTLRMLEAR